MAITAFPQGASSFGGPLLPSTAAIPLQGISTTTGSVWWVDAVNGSAGNGGTSPSDALLTITAALGKCTANACDVIYVQPGTYTTTAAITISKAKVSIIGLGSGRPGFAGPNITASTVGGALMNIAASGVTVQGLTFTGEAARAILDCSVASSFALISGCEFIVPDSATASAIASTAAWTECSFVDCTIKALGTITTLVAIDGGNNLFERCLFLATVSGKTVTTGILSSSLTKGLLVNNCRFMERDSAVFTTGIDLSNGTYNFVTNSLSNMGTQANFLTFTGTGNGALGNNVANGTV